MRKRLLQEVVIATKNRKKLHELRRYLKGIAAKIVCLQEFGKSPRIVENAATFKGNAVKKALIISRFVKGLALADDSGLVVSALDGQPGVKSSRFAGPAKSDKANNRKLLKLMGGVPLKKRQARFVCAVAIADNGKLIHVIEDDCKGVIAFSAKGRHGFGYDPLFMIPKYGRTFGQLGLKTKDRMSHRSKALKKARQLLKQYLKGGR